MEAQQTHAESERLTLLLKVYEELSGTKEEELEDRKSEDRKDLDESSVLMAKGSIKYMIDCELAEIVEKVVELCENVSEIYNSSKEGHKAE